jgi:hypothetical protein
MRFFGLDREHLTGIAARIGPDVDEITGQGRDPDRALLEHFDLRGGYLKPAEGEARLAELDPMLRADLRTAGITVDA